MNWLRGLLDSRDTQGATPLDPVSLPPGKSSNDGSSTEDEFETAGEVESEDGDDGKQTLEFGRLQKGGGVTLVGFCEVQNQGAVEACQWRVAQMSPKQRSPACKIRF